MPDTPTSIKAAPPHATAGTAIPTEPSLQVDDRWLDLISDLGTAWAWPLTVILLCFLFQRHIHEILGRASAFLGRITSAGVGPAWVSTAAAPAPPGPPRPSQSEDDISLSAQASKLLSTLWCHQREHFTDEPQKRWTFAISPGIPLYREFLRGVADALEYGLVAVNPENHHVMLSDAGMWYCQQRASTLRGDFYLEAQSWGPTG
jgi:hypothetical protein